MSRAFRTQAGSKIGGADDSTDFGVDAFGAKAFGRIQSGDSETDMADIAVSSKVFVSEYDLHRYPRIEHTC